MIASLQESLEAANQLAAQRLETIEYLKKKECYPQLLEEHRTIIEAIAAGDKDLATRITGQHINNQVDTVVGTLRHKE